MKKYIMCFFLVIFMFLSFVNPVNAYDYKYINVGKEKLKVENRKLVDNEGNEFVMNGIAIAQVFGLNFKTERYSKETFQLLKEAGFNSIRFQLTSELFYNYSTKEWNQTNIDILKELMQNAEDVGIYIIVDMHGLKNGDPNSFDSTEGKEYCFINEDGHDWTNEFYTVWEKIAENVKDYKSLLAYELLNEPQGCYKTTQQALMDYYSNFLQTIINKIRSIDPDTIISFQPIHNFRKYSDSSYYPFASPEISKFPTVTGGNFLVDSRHEYSNLIYSQEYRVINMTSATGVESESGNYYGYNSPGISNYDNLTNNMTVSQTLECKDASNACRLSWFVTDFRKFTSGTVNVKNIKLYQINENGDEYLAFEASNTDPSDRLTYFKIQDLFNTYNVDGNNSQRLWDPISNLHIGIEAGKKVRIELNMDITGYDSTSGISFEYSTTRIKPNKRGYALVQGRDKLEDYFANLDEISAGYGSPLYFGEFCLIAQYVNEYSNTNAYTDDFYDLAHRYHLNWIWHRMSEYPSDNGFGAYINGITPTVENRRPNQWAYGLPKLLSLTPEYATDSINEQNNDSKKKEHVSNPKTGVVSVLIPSVLFASIIGYICINIYKKDKFKTDI